MMFYIAFPHWNSDDPFWLKLWACLTVKVGRVTQGQEPRVVKDSVPRRIISTDEVVQQTGLTTSTVHTYGQRGPFTRVSGYVEDSSITKTTYKT